MRNPDREIITIVQPLATLNDPHVCTDDRSKLSLLFSLYEPLVRRKGKSFRPALAQSWDFDPEARTWTFELRADRPLHNGGLLDSNDVVASLERVRDPNMEGELGTQGVYRSYFEGARFERSSEASITITTAEPMADLLDLIVDLPIAPQSSFPALPNKVNGTGPYRLIERSDEHVVMERFSHYPENVAGPDHLLWQAELKPELRAQKLLEGSADLVTDIPESARSRVRQNEDMRLITQPSSVCTVFMCNHFSGVCTDVKVRQALNYALNVPAIIDQLTQGEASPLNGPLTPLHFGHDPDVSPFPHDPKKARALLEEAGYASGLDLQLDVPNVLPDEAVELAHLLALQYQEVGIHAHVHTHEDRPAYALMVRDAQMRDAACFDSSPLSTFRLLREKFHSGVRGAWWLGYKNSAVDRYVDQAQRTADEAERQRLYRQAYRHLRDDAPWIFLYNPHLAWGVGSRLAGWQPTINGLVQFSP